MKVTCSSCGKQTVTVCKRRVSAGLPIYCSECAAAKKRKGALERREKKNQPEREFVVTQKRWGREPRW